MSVKMPRVTAGSVSHGAEGDMAMTATAHETTAGPLVGRPVLRVEDARFVTGAGCYVGDFHRERTCHAAVVRSPVAHARLTAVHTRAALDLRGVVAVLTAADLGDLHAPIPIRLAPLPGFERFLQRPIARDRLRYAGERVALVLAEDRYVAEDAVERVTVDYELLNPVVDPRAAMSDATVLHESAGTNVASRYTVSRGDPDAAFAGAEYTRRETFRGHRHSAMPIETRGLVAEWDARARKLTVWGATKVAFFNRRALAQMLGLPEASVELVELDVGGSFGVRGEFYPEDFLIPFAAMRVGRPVTWIEGRREHLLAANHSRAMECELEIAARRDGTILGLRARLVVDMGAYVRTNGGVVPAKAAQFLPGPYRIAHFGCEVRAVVTSTTPVGTYRGPGRFEANFFRERLLDLMSADLGLDPAGVRLRNLLTPDELPYPLGKLCPTRRRASTTRATTPPRCAGRWRPSTTRGSARSTARWWTAAGRASASAASSSRAAPARRRPRASSSRPAARSRSTPAAPPPARASRP